MRNPRFGRMSIVPSTTVGTIGTPDSMAMTKGPFLNGCRSPVSDRVPSGKTIALLRSSRSFRPATLRDSMAADRLSRSMKTWPAASVARPKTGTLRSSCFATKWYMTGRVVARAKMSYIDWWLAATIWGRSRSMFSRPMTRTGVSDAQRTQRLQVRAAQS